MNLLSSLSPAYAEIFLLVMVCVILIADLFIVNYTKTLTYLLVQLSLLGCSLITVATHQDGIVHMFHHMFVDDLMSDVLKLLTYLSVSMMLVYSRSYLMARGLFTGEFLALVLFATLGMMVMISASNFLSLYLGLELLALSLYTLVALQRDSAVATESAMKYFILGAMASGFLLYGMSMLYGATGSLDVNRIAEVIHQGTANKTAAGVRSGLHRGGSGVQAGRGAVPYVGAGRVSRRTHRDDHVHRLRAQAGGVRFCHAPSGGSAATADDRLVRHADDSGRAVHGRG